MVKKDWGCCERILVRPCAQAPQEALLPLTANAPASHMCGMCEPSGMAFDSGPQADPLTLTTCHVLSLLLGLTLIIGIF